MIKRAAVGVAAAALTAIAGGIALAHAGTDSTAQPTAAATGTVIAVPPTLTPANWHWVNGAAKSTSATPAGWLDKPHEDVL
jgi:hypothetical protein